MTTPPPSDAVDWSPLTVTEEQVRAQADAIIARDLAAGWHWCDRCGAPPYDAIMASGCLVATREHLCWEHGGYEPPAR